MSLTIPQSDRLIDWQSRCNMAESILNQRDPSEHAARMATAALAGVDADGLLTIERTAGER